MIIGGCGFIGYHLANKLAKREYKNKITIIDNLSRGTFDHNVKTLVKREKVKLLKIDLTKKNNFNNINNNFDYIFQFAAILGVDNVIMKPSDVLYNNVMIHFSALKIAKKQKKLKKFIFSSTSEVFIGSSLKNRLKYPTKENYDIVLPDLKNPRSSYMISKIFCESLNNLSNLPYLNIRPHNIFGPRMGFAHVIPEIIINSLNTTNHGKFLLKNPNHKRSFCYITDAINQILFISSSKKYINDTINIGSDKNETSIKELVKKIHNIIKRDDIKVINLKHDHNSSPKRRLPDMFKIKKNYLNYNKVDLNKGIKFTAAWYKKNFV